MGWFLPRRRDGSGSLVVATRSDNNNPAVFTDIAARDAYTATQDGTADAARINVANANRAQEVFAIGTLDGSNNVTAITAAFIRVNNAWVAVATNLVGTPGTDGMDGMGTLDQNIPAGTLLVAIDDNGNIVPGAAAAIEESDRIRFTKQLESPDSGAYILGHFDISNAGNNICIHDLSDLRTFYPVAYELQSGGSTRPWYELFAAEAVIPSVPGTGEEITGSTISFTIIEQPRSIETQYVVTVPADAIAVTDCNLIIRENGLPADRPALFDFKRSTGGTGFDLAAGDGTDPTEVAIALPRPVFFRTAVAFDVEIVAGDGQTLRLLGETLDFTAEGFGMQSVPSFETTARLSVQTFLANQSELVDEITAAFDSGQLTITLGRVGESDLTTTVMIPTTGGGTAPVPQAASITRFDIDGVQNSVLAGTVLDGTQTFNYNVNHPEDVNGNLSLLQNGTVLRSDIDPALNTFDQAITSVSLTNNQQAVFELRGATNEDVLISAFFRVRAHLPAEQLFYGLSSSNNPDTVDVTTLQHIEAGIDRSQIETGTTTAGDYFIVLAPIDHDLTAIIDGLDQDVTNIFTRTPDVRTLNSVLYVSYVFGAVNAGASESYTLRF